MPRPYWFNDVDYPKASFDVDHIENCPILASDCGHCRHVLDKGLFYYAKHQIYIFIPFYAIMLLTMISDCSDERQTAKFIKITVIPPSTFFSLTTFLFAKFIYKFITKSRHLANFRALNKRFKIFILSSRLDKVNDELLDRKATIIAVSRFL